MKIITVLLIAGGVLASLSRIWIDMGILLIWLITLALPGLFISKLIKGARSWKP